MIDLALGAICALLFTLLWLVHQRVRALEQGRR